MQKSLILASASPRRRMLLEGLGFRIRVAPSSGVEAQVAGEPASEMVVRLARQKAWELPDDATEGIPIIAADTAVVLTDRGREDVLGKPLDEGQAAYTLQRLSGNEHVVLTGYCVRHGGADRVGWVSTQVWFRALSEPEIEYYIHTGEPMDKAGAYGIQGHGGALVDRISGSYSNVVGLPVAEVLWDLRELMGW